MANARMRALLGSQFTEKEAKKLKKRAFKTSMDKKAALAKLRKIAGAQFTEKEAKAIKKRSK